MCSIIQKMVALGNPIKGLPSNAAFHPMIQTVGFQSANFCNGRVLLRTRTRPCSPCSPAFPYFLLGDGVSGYRCSRVEFLEYLQSFMRGTISDKIRHYYNKIIDFLETFFQN